MANRLYESMTRVVLGEKFTVRVWREESELSSGNNADIRARLLPPSSEWYRHQTFHDVMRHVSVILDSLPRITAYEIVDADGDGALVYPDWK